MEKPQAVIFDWDNTLVDTWNIIFKSLEKTFIEMGLEPMSFQQVKNGERGIHGSLRDSFPPIFNDKWEDAREIYYTAFRAVHLQELQVIEGAKELLEYLKANNIYSAIVSNKTGKYLREEVSHLKWNKYFHQIIGAGDSAHDKPAPDPIYDALKGSYITHHHNNNAENKNIWFIGDSHTDIKTANNSKIRAVYFNQNNSKSYLNTNHDLEINSHQHLMEILKPLA